MRGQERTHSAAAARALKMLRALASPARFRVVEVLAERKDATSPQLMDELGLAQSSLHDHLAALREAGIIQTSGDRPNHYYCLDPKALEYLGAYLSGLGQRARTWAGMVETTQREGKMMIREAASTDASTIAQIYNQGIEDRVATLETEQRTAEERTAWLAARSPRHPVLVAIDDTDTIVGWGSLNPFNPRPVYDHVVDFSLYVAREQRGRGIGDALLSALETRARALGYHKMVLAAFPTNAPGMRLYERHGFTTVGVYHHQGLIDGKWIDVIIMEQLLG